MIKRDAKWRANMRKRVKKSAKALKGTRNDWFANGDEAITAWQPKKPGTARIDVLPYEVKTEGHPDNVAPGELWWKLSFGVHFNIGPNSVSVVCPKSVGAGDCPICNEFAMLAKDWEENELLCKSIKQRRWTVMNILDPEDSDKILLFAMSDFNFAQPLAKELDEEDNDEHVLFFDTSEEGRTLKVRFSEESIGKTKFVKASRIDFKSRGEIDEKILKSTMDLQSVLIVLPADELEELFQGTSASSFGGKDDKKDKDEEDEPKERSGKSRDPDDEDEF